MTIAIPPVPAATLAMDDIGKAAGAPPATGPSMDALTRRFQELMSQPGEHVETPEGPNALSEAMGKQERLSQSVDQQLETFQRSVGHVSNEELTSQSVNLMHSMSVREFQLQAGFSMASSLNKSLQTLLKNNG